jgi:hypothetical protein
VQPLAGRLYEPEEGQLGLQPQADAPAPPAPLSHHSGATSEVLEVASLIQGMVENSRTASSWRDRCVPHSRLTSQSVSCPTDLMLRRRMHRVAGMSQEAQQHLGDTRASSPPLRSGTPPLSSYRMPQSSESEGDPEREVAELTAVDTFPQPSRMDDYIASLTSRLPHDSVGADASSARSSSSIRAGNSHRSPSPQPSYSISQQGHSPEQPAASMYGTVMQLDRGEISPRVLEAFGGDISPPHAGARATLLQALQKVLT